MLVGIWRSDISEVTVLIPLSQPLLELNRAPDKLHHEEQTDA